MPVRLQSDAEGLSKQSTVFYGADPGGAWATLAVDLSQYFVDLTVSGSTAYEDSPASARFNFGLPRTIGCVAEIDDTSTGPIFDHGAGAVETQLSIDGSSNLIATHNGSTVGTLALPVDGTARPFVLAWVTRRNRRATGLSDYAQSWLLAYDVDNDALQRVPFFHTPKAHTASRATWGGLSPATVSTIWIASAAQSASEILRDLGYYAPTGPTTDCDLDLPPLPVDAVSSAYVEDAWYGPLPQWAAVHARHAMRRHWSPLANAVYRPGEAALRLSSGDGDPAFRLVPGSLGYRMNVGWLAPAPVPPGCTHAWVRLHVRSWVDSGLAVPLGLRVVSMSRRPDAPGGPLVVRQVGEIVTRNDAGAGQWDVEQLLELAVGEDGWTYLCPAFAFDPLSASANDAAAAAQINAFHAIPCVRE